MGGHGGLNILPQKRWNVYGRENRNKVAEDEAKYEEQQREKRARHQKAEGESRRALLLQRAQERRGDAAQPSLPPAEAPAPTEQTTQQVAAGQALQEAAPAQEPAQAGGLLKHINFWAEEEVKLEHPEVKAERRGEQRRRGKADTQTSDARFDEGFQLAHRMHGRDAQPWYVQQPGSNLKEEEPPAQLQWEDPSPNAAALAPIPTASTIKSSSGVQALLTDKPHKRHRERKEHRRKKYAAAQTQLDRLRQERQQRETIERLRQQQLLKLQRC